MKSSSEDLFYIIFSVSDVAKQFQCGCNKSGHVAHIGLASYFHELMSKLSDCPCISLSFDNSSNIWVQKGELDVIIWLWGSETNFVATWFLGLHFVGRSTAENVLQTFAGIIDHGQSDFVTWSRWPDSSGWFSCYHFFILVDVGFTLSIIVFKKEPKN